ncbi:MAG TPA: hypothetical protein VJ957_07830 [Longimicrobiales bacterium]|nr:hypothetical protein [Longimicrobiales bacterium]
MGLDIRLPLGLLFAVLGAVLVIWGAVSNPAIYQRSLGYNVNVIWGAVLLAFGLLFISVSRRKLEPPEDTDRQEPPSGSQPRPGPDPQ